MSSSTISSATSSAILSSLGAGSGINTSTIVSALVSAESIPLNDLSSEETALKSQISQLGSIASALTDLASAAQSLRTSGAMAVTQQGTTSDFSVTPGANASAGSYSVEIDQLALPAKARSGGFASGATVTGGTLHLGAQGKTYDVSVADGSSLADVASSINSSGAPVQATVLNDGTNSYLSLTARQSGYPVGGSASDALSMNFDATGSAGQALAFSSTQTAQNAKFQVDGLAFERTSNSVDDAVPGLTLNLTSASKTAQQLTLVSDASGTAKNLQTFVDAYNKAINLVQGQLDVSAGTNRSTTLAGDPTVRNLQQQLQGLITTVVPGLGDVSSLANLGITTAKDGTLSIDQSKLTAAIAESPTAVNAIFAQAGTGLAAATQGLVDTATNAADGLLTVRQNGLNDNVKDIDRQTEQMQARIDAYQAGLEAQFSAMESLVASFKSTGSYLTQLENAGKSSS